MDDSARLLQPEPELGDAATRSALLELGADPVVELTDAERTQLLEHGYVNLGQLLTRAQCEEAKRRIRAQLDREAGSEENVARRAREPNNITHPDDVILGNVFNKCNYDGLFDVTVAHPKLLAAMRLMLGDHVRRFSLNVRGAAPGSGNQALHTDWGKNPGALQDPPSYQITNSIWMLDEFTESNGATRVLPGSHRTGDGGQPPPSLVDAAAPHPEQVLCTGPQGSVVVFSSHCFHGGTLNVSSSVRMAMHSAFVRRQVRYNEGHSYDQGDPISPAVFQRLAGTKRGRAVIALLDISRPEPLEQSAHGPKL